MLELFVFIIIIYVISKKNIQNSNITEYKINTLFKAQHFFNISKDTSIPGILLISASSRGENYLFAIKRDMSQFSISDINIVYEKAQESHTHNAVILQSHNLFSNDILEKIKEYNIKIWDHKKIDSLIYSPTTSSILSTSDTSDDTCKIDANQFDPIQKPSTFLQTIFKKPDKL